MSRDVEKAAKNHVLEIPRLREMGSARIAGR
jgi:hypothetical protein